MTSRPMPRAVRADDLLPTAEAVTLTKGFAARACALQAADCAWPHNGAAVAWIELIPVVALAVLVELCPEVDESRLAQCLGLYGSVRESRVLDARRRERWSDELVAAVAQQVRAGA